jgi:dTDP-4-dehydrorhamnose reductase
MNNRPPRILLTGCTGLIATHIAELGSEDIDLILTSRSIPEFGSAAFFQFDWNATSKIQTFLSSIKPDIIIHTAGVTSVDYAEQRKPETDAVNVQAVQEIVAWCASNDCHLVHFSTDFVFDGNKGLYAETDEAKPISYYGQSKLKSESLVLGGLQNAVVIRTVLVYGYSRQLSRLNFPIWLKQQLENRNELNITADQFRTPTYAEDLAQATLDLALSDHHGLFHVSGPEYLNVYEFAEKVCQVFDLDADLLKPSATNTMGQAGQRPLKTGFNIDKVGNTIGFEPLNVMDGLAKMRSRMISA